MGYESENIPSYHIIYNSGCNIKIILNFAFKISMNCGRIAIQNTGFIIKLSYIHSTEPMETKLWLNDLTKIKQYELILYHADL